MSASIISGSTAGRRNADTRQAVAEADPESSDSALIESPDSEDEWDVEDILAERTVAREVPGSLGQGERRWLVKWTGFPLYAATWEPRDNLIGSALLDEWEQKKEEIRKGTVKPFRLRDWKKAYREHHRLKINKRKRHNKARLAKGEEALPVTLWSEVQEYTAAMEPDDDSEDEPDWTALDRVAEASSSSSEYPTESDTDSTPSSCRTMDEQVVPDTTDRQRLKRQSSRRAPTVAARGHGKGNEEATGDHQVENARKESTAARKVRTGSGSRQQVHSALQTAEARKAVEQPRRQTKSIAHKNPSVRSREPIVAASNRPAAASIASSKAPPSRHRAIKSRTQPNLNAGVNVFTSGTIRKKRQTIEEAAQNPMTKPKMLNLRHQRIIQQRARNKEGERDPQLARRKSAQDLEANATGTVVDGLQQESSLFVSPGPEGTPAPAMSQEQMGDVMNIDGPDDQEASCNINIEAPSAPRARPEAVKRRRSVRFTDEPPDTAHVEEEDHDMIPQGDETPAEDSVFQKLPQAQHEDVLRTCELGPSPPRKLDLIFEGLSKDVMTSDLPESGRNQALLFNHYCSSDDFAFGASSLQAGIIAVGQARANRSPDVLRNLNQQLSATGIALLSHTGGICILLIPNPSPDWQQLGIGLVQADGRDQLSFVIFRPAATFESQILNSFDSSSAAGPSPLGGTLDLNRLLNFRYGRLLPAHLRGDAQATFFLLFSQGSSDECSLLAQWLRQCETSCRILTSIVPGNWSSFSGRPNGVVIIHQDAMETVRHLPGLGQILHSHHSSRNFSFWVYSEDFTWQWPGNIGFEASEEHDEHTAVFLKPVFPDGTVFLITPSFLLAQPHKAYDFLKWFSKEFIETDTPTGPMCKLALGANLEEWLAQLILQTTANDARNAYNYGNLGNGITVRSKTRRLITKLLSLVDDQNMDSFANPLVLAPSSIDGNDEQSLVHWFSSWALTQLGMFRRFVVVGTGHSDRSSLTKQVCAPRYNARSVPDPGFSMDEVQDASETSATGPVEPTALDIRSAAGFNNVVSKLGQLIHEADGLTSDLPVVLFRFPVCYYESDMAARIPNSQLSTFERWFNFFHDLRANRGRNTHIGVFLTIEGSWDPDAHEDDVPYPNRPWIAIFRPQNPHKKPWTSTELFIWDAALSQQFLCADEIFEADLIPAQRALIAIVGAQNAKRNPEAPLKQVWIGGSLSADRNLDLLGHTATGLKYLLQNFKSDLSARTEDLPHRGWKVVSPGLRPAGIVLKSAIPKSEKPTIFTVGDSDTEDDGVDRKIVFHPPRGPASIYSKQVENLLLKATQRARDRGDASGFQFTFTVTKLWYGQLKPAKRHSEHVRVEQWTTIFKELGIPVEEDE